MKQFLRLGDGYALTRYKPRDFNIRYISLMAAALFMCLTAAKQVSAQQAEPADAVMADTTKSVRDTIAMEEVIINTGYERISPERMTGSYVTIDKELLNRGVTTNILDRLEGVTSGLIFPKVNSTGMGNQPTISIRGRSTLSADAEPLVILDNFPYDGDLSNLNPNDIESITVLKDAAAASIWGARSGNGVIVITTRKGDNQQRTNITFNANTTIGSIPDLFYAPQLTSSEFIDEEIFLYKMGRYNSQTSSQYAAVSPVVDLLEKIRKSELTETEGYAEIDRLRKLDIREQEKKYYYQHQINQQYAVSIRGGNKAFNYLLSTGYDNNRPNGVGSRNERFTLNSSNQLSLLDQKLKISSNLSFSSTTQQNLALQSFFAQPYLQLADQDGQYLAHSGGGLKPSYIDTAGNGKLLDWTFRPLEEMGRQRNQSHLTDLRINGAIDYSVIPTLTFSLNYQYGQGNGNVRNMYGEDSFYVRDMVNKFSSIDNITGEVKRTVPQGAILNSQRNTYTTHYLRAQARYNKAWQDNKHQLALLAAFEVNDRKAHRDVTQLYGYDPATETNILVDYLNPYPQFHSGGSMRIPNNNDQAKTVDRFRSFLANVSYTLQSKYTLYASARKDESNLFGVATNQKGVPLWSVGGSWDIHNEHFYHIAWLPYLKARLTWGKQGNVDRSVSAYTVIRYETFALSKYGKPVASITNPPNPSLRWETVSSWNAGVDFRLFKSRISGSIDIYEKNAHDLIANAPISPQIGMTDFRGNTADLKTNGIDLALDISILKNQTLGWYSNILYSYNKDKVMKYHVKQRSNIDYLQRNTSNPHVGYPYTALFSFPYAGLDQSGNPIGLLNGENSQDYVAINNILDVNQLIYHGPQTPTHFGAFRNSIRKGAFEVSLNITYKLGHFFRRTSLDNTTLYGFVTSYGMADYAHRWRKPGDEKITDIPSLIYPANSQRTNLYTYSEALVERAGLIRLQDISMSYVLGPGEMKWLPKAGKVKVYAYINNIGVIWRANKHQLDPDVFQSGFPAPRTYALGVSIDL